MVSRAVHIEIANSLTTDSFINAYRRFVSRRGLVRQLRSDQGSNFVGARRELAKALNEMDQQAIKAKLLEDSCDWFSFRMNTPAPSHMGGVWDRQIRSVRNVLSSLLEDNGRQLDDESLRNLLCEAEAIVSRWKREFLLGKQQRQKWTRGSKNLQVNDVVIVKDDNLPRTEWKLARVSSVYPTADGLVRKVQVTLADSCLDKKGKRIAPLRCVEWPIQKLVLLPIR